MDKVVKYLYLDDNDKITRDGDVELLNSISKRIEVETEYPSSWKQRSKTIFDNLKTIDGIILDWEFTNKSEDAKHGTLQAEDVDFSAESLAEHIRVNVVQNSVKDVPIILCSADKNKAFSNILNREMTSRNLFDLTFIKSDLFGHHVKGAEAQLYDLAISYRYFQQKQFNLLECLSITESEVGKLDIRFIDQLENTANSKTTHDLVRFLLQEFIFREGPLIDESVLASRLGIDKDKSGEDWLQILKSIKEAQIAYQGVLSIGWQRYWSFRLLDWWDNCFKGIDLRTTSATERVGILNKHFNLKLITAEKLKFTTSDEFWTICYGTKKPLDPVNGFIIGDSICNPWLELQYVSAIAELEKIDSNAWRINVIDRERFNRFKAMISKGE